MPDQAGLDALLAQARALLRDDPRRSLTLFEHVARQAADTGKTLIEADAWLGYGEAVGSIDGRERESLSYFRRAADLAPGTTVAALAWLSAGDILRFCGDSGPAGDAFSRAVTLFADLNDPVGECLARKALAESLLREGRADEAEPHLIGASALALDTDEPAMAAELQMVLAGTMARRTGRTEATAPLAAAAGLARLLASAQAGAAELSAAETRVRLEVGRQLLTLAVRQSESGTQGSDRWFAQAARQFAAAGDRAGLVQAEAGRLQALADLEQWDQTDSARRVVAMTETDRTPQGRASRLVALVYLVQALTAGQQHAEAASAATQAAGLAAETEQPELEARFWLGAGHSLRAAERFADAAGAYEKAAAVSGRRPGASGWEAEALEGLGAALRDSPQTGAARLRSLADRYAGAGDPRMEALCRHELARCLERLGPDRRAECAGQYAAAARLFDGAGDVGRAGDSWYRAANVSNILGLLDPAYRERCYEEAGLAAARFEATGNMWGKGLAEFLAGQTLRTDDPGAPPDPRNLPALRRSVRSFADAGRVVEETGSRLAVTAALCQAGTDNAWIASALVALRRYEDARGELLIPQRRSDNDRQVRWGLLILSRRLWRAWAGRGGTRRWTELAWRLEQAAKARSFLDQHGQDEAWNSLVASDAILRELIGKIESFTLRLGRMTRDIDAKLVAGRPPSTVRKLADERNALGLELEQAERQLDRRTREAIGERPDAVALASVAPVSPAQLQACLRPGEAYLGYMWNSGSPIRSLVTPDLIRIEPTAAMPADYVRLAVAAARDGEVPPAIGTQDAVALLGRIPSGVDTLIISPDGLLNGFPWHQMPLPAPGGAGPPLEDRYATAVVPAAGLLPRLRDGHGRGAGAGREDAYLGVACDGTAAGAPLACVDGEVMAVARDYFGADPGSGFLTTADCDRLLERGCRVGLLHLACHAERSGLQLSPDGTWITPVDLAGRGLRARILLMTGCRAGDFSEQDGNEFLGVVRQLLIAARSAAAIVSVAAVPDHAAPVFADLVVSALTGRNPGRPWPAPARPLTVGPAVAWARRTLRQRSRADVVPLIPDHGDLARPWDPQWWSPWFVVGDPQASLAS